MSSACLFLHIAPSEHSVGTYKMCARKGRGRVAYNRPDLPVKSKRVTARLLKYRVINPLRYILLLDTTHPPYETYLFFKFKTVRTHRLDRIAILLMSDWTQLRTGFQVCYFPHRQSLNYRALRASSWRACCVFGRYSVQVSARRLTAFSGDFRGLPRGLQTYTVITSRIRPGPLPFTSFPIHCSPTILHAIIWIIENTVK
jgi:hypothetical protein